MPQLVWTRDSTPAWLGMDNAFHAVCTVASYQYRFADTHRAAIHTAPFLEGSEGLILLSHGQRVFLADCSRTGPFPSRTVAQDFGSKLKSVASGFTHLAIICQQRPACMQLFVLAAGPMFVPTHQLELAPTMLACPGNDAQQWPGLAFSPDDSHIAVVHPVMHDSLWAGLSILSTRTGHIEQRTAVPAAEAPHRRNLASP